MSIALALLVFDLGVLIKGLIFLLLAALVIGVVCYIVARLIGQFVPGAAPFVWIIWCIGGLIVLLFAWQIFAPMLA
jgi:hypothetical protein